MKTLIFAIAVVLFACSENEDPKVYDSLLGQWKISGESIKGDFELELDVSGDIVVGSGGVTYDNQYYPVTIKRKIETHNDYTVTLFIAFDTSSALSLRFCSYDSKFTTLEPTSADFYIDNVLIGDYTDLEVTRP
jgi:hypothetical protein